MCRFCFGCWSALLLNCAVKEIQFKSGFASERTYSPVPRNGSVNDSEAKDVDFLAAKKCSGKSMFYLVLDVNISARDTIFVKKKCTPKICFLN